MAEDKAGGMEAERRPLVILDLVVFLVLLLVFVRVLRATRHPELEHAPNDGEAPHPCMSRLMIAGAACALVCTVVADCSARAVGLR